MQSGGHLDSPCTLIHGSGPERTLARQIQDCSALRFCG